MRIVMVGGRSRELAALALRENNPGWVNPVCFETPDPVEKYVAQNRIDAAMLELDQEPGKILEFAQRLQKKIPGISLIFVSQKPEYAAQAFQMGAADYLQEPITYQRMEAAIDRAERLCRVDYFRIWARTFGYFDLFVDGHPVRFSRKRSKEILAYLVDRWGGTATSEQIIANLWEDRAGEESARACFQTDFKALRADLEHVDAGQILHSARGQKWLDTNRMDCDYYRLAQGNADALDLFSGQYMAEYSWAEKTTANCVHAKERYLTLQKQGLQNMDNLIEKSLI